MSVSFQRTDEEIAQIYSRRADTVYRVCFAYMKNRADTEDAVQETFLRLIKSGPAFQSDEHEKAWLIKTASNVCRNALKHWWRKGESLEDHGELASGGPGTDAVLQAVTELQEKYKAAVYLYYYEGYSGDEAARILGRPPSTVRGWLREARALLKERLGEDICEEQQDN